MSNRNVGYVERTGGERTILGIAMSVQFPGDPPDPIEVWRLEQELEDHLTALLPDGGFASVAIEVSGPHIGDSPEWLIERATPASVRKFIAARSGVPGRSHYDDVDGD